MAILRIIQLFYRLKFNFARENFHPIFVVVCRLVSICLGMFKIWCNSSNLMSQIINQTADDMKGSESKDLKNLKQIQNNYSKNKSISMEEIKKLRLFF